MKIGRQREPAAGLRAFDALGLGSQLFIAMSRVEAARNRLGRKAFDEMSGSSRTTSGER
jgi:hypothetical protein